MARLGLLTLLLAAAPARAQVETAVGVQPGDSWLSSSVDRSTAPSSAVTPLSLALSLSFDTATWAAVGVSTSAPASDMAELLARGYYRLELLQMTLLARDSGKRLLDMRTRRTKDGRSLRQLAEEEKLSYEVVLDSASALARGVDARLKEISEPVPPLRRNP